MKEKGPPRHTVLRGPSLGAVTELGTQTRVAASERTGSRVVRLCYASGYARSRTPARRARRTRARDHVGAPERARSRARRRASGVQMWSQVDPKAEKFYHCSPYTVNGANPISYSDPHGDEIITAMIIGAAISVVGNGVGNAMNDRAFFKGAGKAAIFGAIGGAVSAGIGNVAANMAAAGTSKFGVAAFQAGAHGFTGGTLSGMQGGNFWHGAAAGGISSAVGSGITALGGNDLALIAGGTLAGGLGAKIAGGSFWQGAAQGAITGILNHAAHELFFSGPPWEYNGRRHTSKSELYRHTDRYRCRSIWNNRHSRSSSGPIWLASP